MFRHFPVSRWTFLQVGSAKHPQAQGPAFPAPLFLLTEPWYPSMPPVSESLQGKPTLHLCTAAAAHPSSGPWEGRGYASYRPVGREPRSQNRRHCGCSQYLSLEGVKAIGALRLRTAGVCALGVGWGELSVVLASARPPGRVGPPPLQCCSLRSWGEGDGEAPGMRSAASYGLFSTAEKLSWWSILLTTLLVYPKAQGLLTPFIELWTTV